MNEQQIETIGLEIFGSFCLMPMVLFAIAGFGHVANPKKSILWKALVGTLVLFGAFGIAGIIFGVLGGSAILASWLMFLYLLPFLETHHWSVDAITLFEMFIIGGIILGEFLSIRAFARSATTENERSLEAFFRKHEINIDAMFPNIRDERT